MSVEAVAPEATTGSGRGRGRGRGGGRASRGRGLWRGGGGGTNSTGRGAGGGGRGRGRQGGRLEGGSAVSSIAPTTGVPYGYVPGYLPGSSSLVEELDKRVLIVLRDGRHLVGMFRSFDQFGNMVLEDASERRMHRDHSGVTCFADVPLGVYIVRGESLVLLGQITSDQGMRQVEVEELEEMKSKPTGDDETEWDFDKDLLA